MASLLLVLEGLFHYSDILRGELIRALAERYRVIVISPDIDDEAVRRYGYFRHQNVIYRSVSVSYPWVWALADGYLRRYFVRAYDHLVNTQFAFYRAPRNVGERLARDLGALLPKTLFTPSRATWIEAAIARPSQEFLDIVKTHRPKLLVAPTPGYQYLPLVAELVVFAQHLGMPSVAVNCSFDNPYTQPKFLRKTDFISVWNERMAREVAELHGYAPDRIFVAGCLKFDHYFRDVRHGRVPGRGAFLASKGLDPAKKTVLFAAPTPSTWRKYRQEVMAELIGLKRRHLLDGDPNILVRLHPFEDWEAGEEFLRLPGFHIERAGSRRPGYDQVPAAKVELNEGDLVNQTATFAHADVVVNYSSTTLLEACIFDKPVVSVGWPELPRLQFTTEVPHALLSSGAARLAKSPTELAALVNRYLANPALDAGNRTRIVREYVQFTDGRSWERTREAIDKIIARSAYVPQ